MAIMKPTTFRAALFVLLAFLLTAAIAGAQAPSSYRQGTITKIDPDSHKTYFLKGAEAIYEIKNCGDLQIGQAVDYRVDEFTIYIRREGAKDYKCTVGSVDTAVNTPDTPPAPKYQQGTILGYDIRRDANVFGSSGAAGNVYTSTR